MSQGALVVEAEAHVYLAPCVEDRRIKVRLTSPDSMDVPARATGR
jgi:hypothetical protein